MSRLTNTKQHRSGLTYEGTQAYSISKMFLYNSMEKSPAPKSKSRSANQ